ncbi:MAG TPA: hypothetical protein VM008_20695 [Phycisphaerae bacterium]|nr:hypothetical protein [Phycisphaerae bacterium]
MTNFDVQKMMEEHKAKVAKAEADARAKADAWMKDDNLARAKGSSPEQVEARKRVARLFCEIHLPDEKPDQIGARLTQFDYTQTVTTTNGRLKNLEDPKAGFLGFGRKPAYIVSARCPPKTDTDPIYALEYFPVKR